MMYGILSMQLKSVRVCDMPFRRSCPHYANLVNTNAVRSVRRGGNLNDGGNAGPCYMNANNAPSNGNWNYGGAHHLTSQSAYAVWRSLHSHLSPNYLYRISLSGVVKATEIRPTGTA